MSRELHVEEEMRKVHLHFPSNFDCRAKLPRTSKPNPSVIVLLEDKAIFDIKKWSLVRSYLSRLRGPSME